MKNNYKQILEAINKGIKLALDDIENNELIGSTSLHNDVINAEDVIKLKYDLMKEVVDLGLPSGTLWCKYNLGVDLNLLSKVEDWYGDYYAWGELEANKPKFDWDNYKFGIGLNKLTKYCNIPENGLNGFADNITELLSEDDVAYLNKKLHNFKFHIPTKEQCEELLKYTFNYWVNNYNPNKLVHNPKDDEGIKGLNGRVFTGFNGNILFIPAAGYRDFKNYNVGFSCSMWTSSLYLDYPNDAHYLYFNSDSITVYHDLRFI